MQLDVNVRPRGARLRVRLLSMETKTKGGILIPKAVLAGASDETPEQQMAKAAGPPTLQLAEITAVGEGQWSMEKGCYLGSRFKVGEQVLFRCGPMSQAHLDFVHASVDGRGDECLIQESIVAATLEGQLAPERRVEAA